MALRLIYQMFAKLLKLDRAPPPIRHDRPWLAHDSVFDGLADLDVRITAIPAGW